MLTETTDATRATQQARTIATSRGARWWRLFAFAAGLLGGCILFWKVALEDRFIPKRWGVVEAGQIYRSGQVSQWLIEDLLVQHDIKTVIDLNGIETESDVHYGQQAEIAACRKHGIAQYRFPLRGDGTGDIAAYAQAIEVIEQSRSAGKPVLVHCAAGAQRTGGVVAAYRVLVQKRPGETAYAELPQYGWRPGRDEVLLTYLNENMGRLAQLLVDKGVLDRVPEPLPRIGP